MAAARKIEPKSGVELISEVARQAFTAADGDVKLAAEAMEQKVRKDRALRDALTDPLLAGACWAAVSQQMRMQRRTIWNAPIVANEPKPQAPAVREHIDRVVHLATGTLSMFPLPGGKRLAEATREEIVAGAEFYSQRAADAGHKARWLQLVAQSVPSGKTAGDVLTDERLAELQTEARS